MPSFSKRMGLEPEKIMQIDSMDDELRTNLYSSIRSVEAQYMEHDFEYLNNFYRYIWCYFFHEPYDKYTNHIFNRKRIIKLYNDLEWFRVYDFIEIYLQGLHNNDKHFVNGLAASINNILETHNSGYRTIKLKVIPITNEMEIESIAEAAESESMAINTHMKRAIEEFSKRDQPDYSAVIHHSISAVEVAASIASKKEGSNLAKYLEHLEHNKELHSRMAKGFKQFYYYASDKETGIRHGMKEGAQHVPGFEEAKYMIVVCSAFINYLVEKYR